ncbi:uncharacterized protein LOC118599079 isoform X2 [Oryzias melastigma]|uniref:uncharacterized protein LOC118599079 isoform X2 n=1 Tax=Oryzias melastigma TaxID=30732 RepID=UPI00168CDA21|nr:uncharacterized protein LOC118599079 isoform X2 [Oryzias melastigma]
MFYKSAGGGGQRKLSLIPMDTEGYNGQQLRSASNNGKIVLFLVPLQEDMDIDPLPFDAAEFSKMPQVPCVICQTTMPLQMLALHAGNCKPVSDDQTQPTDIFEDETELPVGQETTEDLRERQSCPICQRDFLVYELPYHANECCESEAVLEVLEVDPDQPGPSSVAQVPYSPAEPEGTEAWKKVKNPQKAVELFLKQLKHGGEHQRALFLNLDAGDSDEERDMSLISFYKHQRDKNQWAAPFRCRIQGDAAVGRGVTRHIISSAIAKLKRGFNMNFGMYCKLELYFQCCTYIYHSSKPFEFHS